MKTIGCKALIFSFSFLLSTAWNIANDFKMAASNGTLESVSVDGVSQIQVMIMQTFNTLILIFPVLSFNLVSFILYWRIPNYCRVWMRKWSAWAVELICTAFLLSLFNKGSYRKSMHVILNFSPDVRRHCDSFFGENTCSFIHISLTFVRILTKKRVLPWHPRNGNLLWLTGNKCQFSINIPQTAEEGENESTLRVFAGCGSESGI